MSATGEAGAVAPLLCGIQDAARILGIGRTKTYELIDEGLLETISIGSRRLVTLASIERLIEAAKMDEAA